MIRRTGNVLAPGNVSLAVVPSLLLRILPQGPVLLEPIHKSQHATAAQQIGPPDAVVAQRQLALQPVQVVVVDIKALFSIDSPAAAKCRMENLPIRRRLFGLCQDNDHFGVRAAFVE